MLELIQSASENSYSHDLLDLIDDWRDDCVYFW